MGRMVKEVITKENLPDRFAVIVKDNQSLSRAVQEHLFDLGVVWAAAGGRNVQYTDRDVLFVEYSFPAQCHIITHGTIEYFRAQEAAMIQLVPETTVKLVQQSLQVEIGGRMYDENMIIGVLKEKGLV